MIGYRNIEIGLIAAKMDDVLNYIPARLTAVMFIVSSFMIKMRWKNSIKVYFRDRNKTPSPNSGQAMSALAGALGVRLEKIGFYQIGERIETLKPHDVLKALNVVDVSVSLFVGLIAGVIQLVEYIG
jgi:adenosylcobinamide-phosphate synthase